MGKNTFQCSVSYEWYKINFDIAPLQPPDFSVKLDLVANERCIRHRAAFKVLHNKLIVAWG